MDAAKWIRHTGDSASEIWWRHSWQIAEYMWNIDIRTWRAIGEMPHGEWMTMEMDTDVLLSIARKEMDKGVEDPPLLRIAAELVNHNHSRLQIDVLVKPDNSVDFRNVRGLDTV